MENPTSPGQRELAWCMMGVYEGILGIKRDYDGLRIDPCLPKEWGKRQK